MKFPSLRSGFAAVLLFALIVPILAACGGAAAPSTGEQATSAPAQATAGSAPATGATAEAPAAAETAAPAAGESAGGKVLRIHQITTPDVVDPQKASFSSEIVLLSLNYEGLTKLDKDLKAVPAAAEKWEFSSDGTQLTFHLRDGLKYSDGSPLTAENFRYAVERTCDPKTAGEYQSILFEIVGCEDWASTAITDTAKYDAAKAALGAKATDEKTLVLTFTKPAPYYTYISGIWVFYPAKKELVEKGGDNWWKDAANQIGNGPFQMTSYQEAQLVEFKANQNYWGGKPALDGVDFVYQKETAVALEAYKSGQLDIMQPDPSQLPALKSDPDLSKELLIYPGGSTYNLAFSLAKKPFDDKKVREAFSYAIDRKTYCEQIRTDCLPTLTWIPEGIQGAIKTDKYGFDAEKAKQALAESSYGGPDKLPEIKLTYNADDSATQPRAEWMAGQFRDILGVNVTLDPVEGKTLTALRKSPETHPQMLFVGGWIQDYPDPQNWLSVYWTCNATFAKRFSYCNKQLDEIVAKADVELDPAKRTQLYEQAGQILIDDVPGPFIYNRTNTFLVKPFVKNIVPTTADSSSGWPGQWASQTTVDIVK